MIRMKKRIGKYTALAVVWIMAFCCMTGCGMTAADTEVTENEKESKVNSGTYAVQKTAAKDDFYAYINQERLSSLELHYGDSYGGPAADISEETDSEVYELISGLAKSGKSYEKGSSAELVRDAYIQYVNGQEDAEQACVAEFDRLSKRICDAGDTDSFMELMQEFVEEQGILPYFDVAVGRNYYHSGENAIYIEQKTMLSDVFSLEKLYEGDEPRQQMKLAAYEVLKACGFSAEEAEERAKKYVYLVLEIARNTDYGITHAVNPYITFQYKTEQELQTLFGDLPLEKIKKIYGIEENPYGGIYVQDEGQLKKQAEFLSKAHIEELKTWLLCEFAFKNHEYLGKKMEFLKKFIPAKYESREMSGASYINDIMTEFVGELYAERYYTPEMDSLITKMQSDITAGYDELIDGADWLSKETRTGLKKKLHHMEFIKGAGKPHKAEKKDAALIGENAYDTLKNMRAKNYRGDLELIGKPRDKEANIMPSQIVNSMYSTDNIFCITVAIMHAPYFDVNADYAANMGGLGMVIAHEMGHAFDSNCIEYNAEGNYDPDWISRADREKLEERMQSMKDYYSSFTIMDVYHVDGELTCGENYADKGGMECVMKVITDRKEQKKLFENYAVIWGLMKEDSIAIEELTTNEHSPERIRVNAVLSSTDEFYEVYGVKSGDGMYVEPEKRVFRWR